MRNFNLFFLFFFSLAASVYGQKVPSEHKTVFNDSLIEGRDYFIVYDTIGNAVPEVKSTSTGTSNLSVIVEFTDEPAAKPNLQNKMATSRMLSSRSKIKLRLDQLRADLDRLSAKLSSNTARKGPATKINRSYYKVFSGANVHIPAGLEKDLKALPYVKGVHRDQKVQITLDESISIINADKIWLDYGVYGEGIKVGIIDTGIDYNHPDLGGGFGEGFKVAGGYDFVDNDNDPMDEHSHGTHVAGIVAANGESVKGVAPEATLYALKALSSAGYGFNSDVIAAIEWSVDPNNDGDPADRLDIVNMSLGGPGNSDDPMSVAVDNAVSMGVTFCIAAGNDRDYYTIGSPGTARKAITVGSIDKYERISLFSSKGPTQKNFLIKPDIVAPGSNIRSTVPGGGYAYKNGTSMASPHVAGAAALILNLNAGWGPAEIKNAIMQSARKIEGRSVFDQGAGIIDLKALAESQSLVSPGSISFGVISTQGGIWSNSDTIFVKNRSNEVKSYNITAPNQTKGLEIFFTQQTLMLEPGETGYFLYTATVDPTTVVPEDVTSPDYGGEITVTSGMASHRIPYAFLVGNILSLQFNVNPLFVVIHDQNNQRFSFNGTGKSLEFPLVSGAYDILTYFPGQRMVLREDVVLDGHHVEDIKDTDAVHLVTMKGLDVEGHETSLIEAGYWSLIHKPSGMGLSVTNIAIVIGVPPKLSKRYFSNISDKYEFQSNLRSYATWNEKKHYYNFPVFIDKGISRSFTYSNNHDEFVKLVYDLAIPKQEKGLFYTKDFSTPGRSYTYGVHEPSNVLSYPYKIEQYLLPIPHENFISNLYVRNNIYLLNTDSINFDPELDSLLVTTAYTAIPPAQDKIGFWTWGLGLKQNWQGITKKIDRGYTNVKLLSAPTHYYQNFHPISGGMELRKGTPGFYDSFKNTGSGKITYEVNDEFNNTIYEGITDNISDFESPVFLPLNQGEKYTLKYGYNGYTVADKISETVVSYDFFPELSYLRPIAHVSTHDSRNPTNVFSWNETIDIVFDPTYISTSTKLFYQKEGQSDWIEIPTVGFQDEFGNTRKKGVINGNLSPGYYSLKITNQTNNVQLVNKPAFLVQSNYTSDSLALADFYHSTNGGEWTNKQGWLQSPNLANWHGVTVENGRVIEIDLADNNLSGRVLQGFSKLTGLKKLVLKNNNIEFLGDLSEMDNLIHLDVSDNKLNFQDLLPNRLVQNYVYSPQDSLGSGFVYDNATGQRLELVVPGKNPENTFRWIKDNTLIDTAPDSNKLIIDPLTPDDAGKYICQITNTLLPELQLYSKVQTVNVLPANFRAIEDWEFLRGAHLSTGINWVDYNDDGHLDLFIVGFNAQNKLMSGYIHKNGKVQFEETTIDGVTDKVDFHFGSSWADYNNDGLIDFYLITNNASSKNFLMRNDGGDFIADENSPELNDYFNNSLSSTWADYDNDGLVDLFVTNSHWGNVDDPGPKLFRNSLSNIFKPSEAIRFQYPDGAFSSWADYDNDGDLDLYIGGFTSRMFKNDNGSFIELRIDTKNESFETKGASWGDYDNDGDLDLFVTNTSLYGLPFRGRNALFENKGDGKLELNEDYELTQNVNNSHGSAWGDYDNDGDVDLIVVNFNERNELWQNQLIETGVAGFLQIKHSEIADGERPSAAVAWGDYDKDGDLDLFVANYGGDNSFYENLEQGNNWINILCKGTYTNSSAIGVKVRLKATINGKSHWQLREVSAQTGFAGQNSLNVAFGLGDASIIDSLIVDWPSTQKQVLTGIEPNQFIMIQEPDLFLSPLEDQKMGLNEVALISLEAFYNGKQNLIFSANSDPEKVKSSIESNFLKLESGLWTGIHVIEVSASSGQKTYTTSFNIEVYNKHSITGIQQPGQELSINLYPNPSDGNITFTVSQNENPDIHFEIFNSLGERVFGQELKNSANKNPRELWLNDLKPGVYIAKILVNDELFTKRIIIK